MVLHLVRYYFRVWMNNKILHECYGRYQGNPFVISSPIRFVRYITISYPMSKRETEYNQQSVIKQIKVIHEKELLNKK